MAMRTRQKQVSQDRYEVVTGRYMKYLDAACDKSATPVTVFDPLSPKIVQDLESKRELSRQLQEKKDEDVRKARAAEEEARQAAKNAEEAKENAEEKPEGQEGTEESKPEETQDTKQEEK